MTRIGERLLTLRTGKGLSQNKLARLAGVPQSAISEIEAGKRKNPGITSMRRLAAALAVTLAATDQPGDHPTMSGPL